MHSISEGFSKLPSKRRVVVAVFLVASGLCAYFVSVFGSDIANNGLLLLTATEDNGGVLSHKEDPMEVVRLANGEELNSDKYDETTPENQEEEEPIHIEDGDDDEEGGPSDDFEPAPRTHAGPYNDIQRNQKYFIYSPSGGFNNQREELINAVEIARLLNRTLYVPMAGRHTNFFSMYERLSGPMDLFSMDRILDFPYMETYGVRLVPLNTTVLRMVAKFVQTMGAERVEILFHPERPSPIETWHFSEVLALKAVKKPLLFIRGSGFYHRWFATKVLTQVRKHTRYSEYLRKLSMRVVEKSIGKDFYAMHVRLGDYKGKYPDVGAFVASLVKAGWAKGWKSKKVPLYLATDDPKKSQEDFGHVYQAFKKIYFAEDIPRTLVKEFRSLFPLKSKMKDDMMGILEQLICAQATDFIGTPGSTFSAYIGFMRAMRGFTFPELGAIKSVVMDDTSSSNSTNPQSEVLDQEADGNQ